MNAIDLINKIQVRADNARSGYVKPWKNSSIVTTLRCLKEAGADLTWDRIKNLVHDVYSMEGVDDGTISDVTCILWVHFGD